nr:MAG TPA: hypothetical protein [Crassvirales sp.]
MISNDRAGSIPASSTTYCTISSVNVSNFLPWVSCEACPRFLTRNSF